MKNWLDDPEWEKLQGRINKNSSNKRVKKPQTVDSLSYTHPSKLRRSKPEQSQAPEQKKDTSKQRQNNNKKIHLSLSIAIPKLHLSRLSSKHYKLSGAIIGGLIIGVFAMQLLSKDSPNQDQAVQGSKQSLIPEFDTILPGGKAEEVNGGEVRYNQQKKIVNYKDKITGVDVTVSQQALPDNFKQNSDAEVEKLAKGFNADKPVYAGEVKAFYGVSEDGPQTIIFSKKDLLLFIYAPKELDRDGLIKYIIELK